MFLPKPGSYNTSPYSALVKQTIDPIKSINEDHLETVSGMSGTTRKDNDPLPSSARTINEAAAA